MLRNLTVALLAISLTHSHTTIAANTKLSVITAEIGSKLAVVTAEIGSSHCWIGSSCSLQSQPHTQTYTCTHSLTHTITGSKTGSSIHTHKPIHALTHMQSQGQTLWKLAAVLAKSTRAYIYINTWVPTHACKLSHFFLCLPGTSLWGFIHTYSMHPSSNNTLSHCSHTLHTHTCTTSTLVSWSHFKLDRRMAAFLTVMAYANYLFFSL